MSVVFHGTLLFNFKDKVLSDTPKAIAKLNCVEYTSTILPFNNEKSKVVLVFK